MLFNQRKSSLHEGESPAPLVSCSGQTNLASLSLPICQNKKDTVRGEVGTKVVGAGGTKTNEMGSTQALKFYNVTSVASNRKSSQKEKKNLISFNDFT
jgi:hypothetical protein